MYVWGKWEFSPETKNRLDRISQKLLNENQTHVSNDWFSLLNYQSSDLDDFQMEVIENIDPTENDIISKIKESLESQITVNEKLFVGISINSLSRIFIAVASFLDEDGFCTLCKDIASWNNDSLVEHCLRLVLLPKLKEFNEASSRMIFSIKEIASSKPNQLCENVLIPLLCDDSFQFIDVELLSRIFHVLPNTQRDWLILNFSKKDEFDENDWLLLHPLLKNLSPNSLLILLEVIQKFSNKFTKSQVFGRFLVNFCKASSFMEDKDILIDVVETHQTLLKTQALKWLEIK